MSMQDVGTLMCPVVDFNHCFPMLKLRFERNLKHNVISQVNLKLKSLIESLKFLHCNIYNSHASRIQHLENSKTSSLLFALSGRVFAVLLQMACLEKALTWIFFS